MRQEELTSFLFAPKFDESIFRYGRWLEADRGLARDAGFTAGSCFAGYHIVNHVHFYAWTDEEWGREAEKPAETWPLHGGGRLWAAKVLKDGQHDSPTPLVFRPWRGPAPRCRWFHWLDLEAITGPTARREEAEHDVFRLKLIPDDNGAFAYLVKQHADANLLEWRAPAEAATKP
jgi:hypothetical protein